METGKFQYLTQEKSNLLSHFTFSLNFSPDFDVFIFYDYLSMHQTFPQVHGDVFRAPESLVLFSSMLGTGWQLLLLVLAVIMYAMAGT